jgi:putative transposase
MSKSTPRPLKLEEKERQQLQQLVNRHNTPQQIALRASIILLADAGDNHRQIGRKLNISRDMARLWRNRWLELGEKSLSIVERLHDAPRPGAPATFSLEQILQLFAFAERAVRRIACEKPEVYGRSISHWTRRELAEEMIKQGIVESISPRHVGRLLTEASLKPHQSSYWLNPPPTQSLIKKSKTLVRSTSKPKNEPVRESTPSVSMR